MADETPERTPEDDLLDEFVDSLTPPHHRTVAAMPSNVEMSYRNLREAGRALLAKAGERYSALYDTAVSSHTDAVTDLERRLAEATRERDAALGELKEAKAAATPPAPEPIAADVANTETP